MKKSVFTAMILGATAILSGNPKTVAMPLKVASYNIQSFRGMDSSVTPQKTIAAVKKLDADLVGLQEVRYRATDPVDYLAEIGKACGEKTFFAETVKKPDFFYGIGAVSRFPARVVKEILLPTRDKLEPRKALFLEITTEKGKFYFISTHLSYEDPAGELQRAQLAAILETVQTDGFLPAILTGDLNSTPNSPALRLLKRKWSVTSEAFATYPANAPQRRIDYIAVSDPRVFRLVSQEIVPDGESSDHRPIIAAFDVVFEGNGDEK